MVTKIYIELGAGNALGECGQFSYLVTESQFDAIASQSKGGSR
jgi:hypothetical protein